VIVFDRTPAGSILEHKAVFDHLILGLEEAQLDLSGLDMQLRSGVQSVWAPSTNRLYPGQAFFRSHRVQKRDIERYGLDPPSYLRTWTPKESDIHLAEPIGVSEEPSGVTAVAIEEITAPLAGVTEGRHVVMYQTTLRLVRAGLTDPEIRAALKQAVRGAPHKTKKIPQMIKSARRQIGSST
jgi:hypothetical protein